MAFDQDNPGNSYFAQVGAVKDAKNSLDGKLAELDAAKALVFNLEAEIVLLQESLLDANSVLLAIVRA